MKIINRVQLTGNVGVKPQIRIFEDGNKFTSFSIATNEKYTNRKGEQVVETNWHNVSVRGKLVEYVEKNIEKGSYLSIEGRLTTRSYTDKQGYKKYITEVIASDIIVLKNEQS